MGSKPSSKTREHGFKLTEGMVPENYMQMNGKLEAMPDGELFLLLDLLPSTFHTASTECFPWNSQGFKT